MASGRFCSFAGWVQPRIGRISLAERYGASGHQRDTGQGADVATKKKRDGNPSLPIAPGVLPSASWIIVRLMGEHRACSDAKQPRAVRPPSSLFLLGGFLGSRFFLGCCCLLRRFLLRRRLLQSNGRGDQLRSFLRGFLRWFLRLCCHTVSP